MNRRTFLWLSSVAGLSAGAALLSACGGAAATPAASSSAPSAAAPSSASASPSTPAASAAASQPAASSSASASTSAAPASAAPSAAAASAQSGSKLIAAVTPFVPAFHTGVNAGSAFAVYFWPAFDALTWIDKSGKLQPALAKSWSSQDGKTWVFQLRNDVKFHDGTPLTGEDVAATYNIYRNPANKLNVSSVFTDVTDVKAATDSVTVTLKAAQPVFPQMMSTAFILKARDLKPDDQTAYQDYFKTAIGTGPYRFVGFKANTSLDYQAMAAGFVSPRGAAAVQSLGFRNLPEASSRAAALQTGEVQMIYPVSGDTVAQIKSSGLALAPTTPIGQAHLALKMTDGPLKDVRVRQALNYAVNKDGVISGILGGYSIADGQLIGPSVLGYNPDVKPYPYDVAKAKALLSQAGVANGFDAGTFTYQTTGFLGKPESESVASDLAKVGIKTQLQGVETAGWLQQYTGPASGRSPVFSSSTSWDQTFDAAIDYRWWSADIPADKGRRWDDPTFNDMYQKAKVELDLTQRAELWKKAASYFHDQAPVIFLWLNASALGSDPKKVQVISPNIYFADMFCSQVKPL